LCALLLVAPAALHAQSGRTRQPEPQPTPQPNGQRPRRTTAPAPRPTPALDQPGQPATPDEPRPTAQHTPTPQPITASDPETGQPVEIDPDEVIHVNANLVPIPASVIDELGRPVTDLEVKDFELRVDGQPRPIGDLSRADTPVRLALLFDNSYSLRSAREMEKQSAMRFFRTVIRPVDLAAVYSVDDYERLMQPLTNDVSALVRTVESFGEPEGSTPLFDVMAKAADYLRPQTGRRVIVVVSDGVDTTSSIDFAEAMRRVQSADCQIYVVQNGISDNPNLHDLTAESRMREFAMQTGGAVFAPKTINDLPSAFAQISADLAQQYVLSYYPADDRRDGRFRSINLSIKTRPNMRVRARRGYYPRQSQLSAASGYNYEQVAQSAPAAPDPQPASAAPAVGLQPQPSTFRPSAPATGPSYGSKNLNPDDDAATNRNSPRPLNAGAENRVRSDAAPPVAIEVARLPEVRSEVAATTSPPYAPAAAPTPTPTLAPTPEPTPAPTPTPETTTAKPNAAPTQTNVSAASGAQPTTQTPASQSPTSVPGGVLNGRALKLPKPVFPDTARRMRVTGTVNVEVTIDENGKVIAARAMTGHVLLREAAVDAARRATFTPTVLHDKPVQVTGVIVYNFSQ
jgi:Ca-activated chloride channel family protein